MELNIVMASGVVFPYGLATTKRRRYMVDYMNVQGVECHVLVLRHQVKSQNPLKGMYGDCLLYTSPSPRDRSLSRMPSSA